MDHERPDREPQASASENRYGCPECGMRAAGGHVRRMFCSSAHQQAFNDRLRVRGRLLAPLIMAARITRGGSRGDVVTGRRARRDAELLIGRYVDEDREAGRPSMADYMAHRYLLGFERA